MRRTGTSTGSAALNLFEDDTDSLTAEGEVVVVRQGGSLESESGTSTTTTSSSTAHSTRGVVVRDSSYYISTLCAGVGSGMCSSIICAPLDLVRTRLQVWGNIAVRSPQKTMTTLPSTPMQVVQDILNKEGPKGLFRGLGATMVTVPLFWGVYFPLYEQTKHYVATHYQHMNPSFIHCGSAVFTGAVADVLCNPLFVIRTRLQTQALHRQDTISPQSTSSSVSRINNPTTMRQTATALYQTHGITVFWRGMSANLMGLSHVAIQFPTYEFLKSVARQRKKDQQQYGNNDQQSHDEPMESALDLLLASGLAKMCASLISYPHEVLRSRMMDSRATTAPTLMGTFSEIWATEGPKGLYRGLPITLFRVIPNCCITFLSYEYLKRWSQDHYLQWRTKHPTTTTITSTHQSQHQ